MKARVLVVGSANTDITATLPRFPRPGETVSGTSMAFHPGGKGNNQASAAKMAGVSTGFLSKIGKDSLAITLTDHFAAIGLDTSRLIVDPAVTTGCALIEVQSTDGQNRIVVIPGANHAITPADIQAAETAFDEAGILLTQLEIPLEVVEAALELGRKKGLTTILNPAPATPFPEHFYPLIDYITPNETEAESYSGIPVESDADAEKAARFFLDKGVGHVIITLGKRGSYYTDGTHSFFTPAFTVDAVDTTGAGDAFNGAFAAALAEGMDAGEAIRFATAFSAISVTRPGAASSMPTKEETEAFLAQSK